MPNTYKPVTQITKQEWVKYRWVEVTTMSDPETMMLRTTERTPDEAAKALEDWDRVHQYFQNE